jgi:hypothetical protein
MNNAPPTVHTFRALGNFHGYHGCFPVMVLVCRVCGRVLYGDWQWNFTNAEAHKDCVRADGCLDVNVEVLGLERWQPEVIAHD